MTPSIRTPDPRPRATSAAVSGDRLQVTLEDGRELSVPITWFGWLGSASETERADIHVIEFGLALWWETLDEGVSVPWLLGLPHH